MRKILLNMQSSEKRAAVVENNKLVELLFEADQSQSIVGNIYKGRVVRVVPGMQAAFVNIGLEKNGFLTKEQLHTFKYLEPTEKEKKPIQSLIQEGQEILVQVTKDEFGEKGPRLTTLLELPGHYVVLLPNDPHIAVSKKMDHDERESWRLFGRSLCNENEGVIIRTACAGESQDIVQSEVEFLQGKWSTIVQEHLSVKPPFLLFKQSSLEERIIRDLTSGQPTEMIVDDGSFYRTLKDRLSIYKNESVSLSHYIGKENIFSKYEIEEEIDRSLRPFVWLKNAASLMIEQTEALTVIDVNTGKYTGKYNVQDTIVKTNELAAIEIARQLRLREIGGIVLIDFINMDHDKDREFIKSVLAKALRSDRSYTRILGFTQLGLLEMTRKKERKSLLEQMTTTCPTCNNLGKVYSSEQIAFRIERALWEYKGMDQEAIWIEAPENVVEHFTIGEHLKGLEEALGFRILLTSGDGFIHSYEMRHIGSLEEVQSRLRRL